MNLLQDVWLPFRLQDGSHQNAPLSEIANPCIVDFSLPRADFQGAAYQFAISVLQTVFAPEDTYQWLDRYRQPPTNDELQQCFEPVLHAFNASGDGPLFMQDFDALESAKPTSVAGLLIEAPGANGIKQNTDHFVKRGIGEVMSLEMAVLALFTLQINAPAGGQGHRVGLRGGGPLTTLVMPQGEQVSLWQKLWLNVINREEWDYAEPDFNDADVFPWLAPTKTSDKKGTEIYHTDIHPLQILWAMPRRIRLQPLEESAMCAISGAESAVVVRQYKTQNYGINYAGDWSHPFTPYKWNPKKPDEDRLSIKGQPGGITYKIWDALTLTEDSESIGQQSAGVVKHFYQLTRMLEWDNITTPRLWAFGYDMDNMKARGWYSTSLPIFSLPVDHQSALLSEVKRLQNIASDALWQTRTQIKTAWFERPGDAKGDTSFIDVAFWQRTETAFFNAVHALVVNAVDDDSHLNPEQATLWLRNLHSVCVDLFDEYALSDIGSERSIVKRMKARRMLTGWLYGGKNMKNFIAEYQIAEAG